MRIFVGNRTKSGVYYWFNKINDNIYIGNSSNLSVGFYTYYSLGSLVWNNRPIDYVLLRYKFFGFTLEILEYCDTNLLLTWE